MFYKMKHFIKHMYHNFEICFTFQLLGRNEGFGQMTICSKVAAPNLKVRKNFFSSNYHQVFSWRCDYRHNDIQHNGKQCNNIQHNDKQYIDIQHNGKHYNDIQQNDKKYNDIQHYGKLYNDIHCNGKQ
jgi:hypothetical protein